MFAAQTDAGSGPVTKARHLCPLCHRENQDVAPIPSPHAEWILKQCPTCQLVYLQNVVTVDQLREDLSWTDTFHAARKRQLTSRLGRLRFAWRSWRLRLLPHRKAESLIHRYVVEGQLLDLGCGRGKMFDRLRDSIIPIGIEVDERAAASAASRAEPRGGRVLCSDALTGLRALEAASLDGVLMSSYLEHENEPLPVLHEVARTLRTGGILIVKVPNYDCWNRRLQGWRWPGFRFPEHVNYFTPATLSALLRAAGFEALRFSWRDRLPTSDNMWLVARNPVARTLGVVRPRQNKVDHQTL